MGHQAIRRIVATINGEHSTRLKRVKILGLAAVSIDMARLKKFPDTDASDVVAHLVYALNVTTDNSIKLGQEAMLPEKNASDLNPRSDDSMSVTGSNTAFRRLSEALALIAPKLPIEGENSMRKAVRRIRIAMQSTQDPAVMDWLSRGLTTLAEDKRMTVSETREALGCILAKMRAPASRPALPSLTNAAASMVRSFDLSQLMYSLDHALAALESDLEPELLDFFLSGIKKIAALVDPSDVDKAKIRIIAVTSEPSRVNDQIMHGLILALDALPGEIETTELVELLKSPFCTGDAQQSLLRMIEAQTKLSFEGNPWRLVEQAKEAGLDPQVFRDLVRPRH